MQKIEIKDRGGGITAESLNLFHNRRGMLGQVLQVRCRANVDAGSQYNTTIVGTTAIMRLSGFNCGYGGEGPHGLYKLVKELGLESRPFWETEIPTKTLVIYDGGAGSE
jgi:hypothetical protein